MTTGTNSSSITTFAPRSAPVQGFWHSLVELNLSDDTMFILTRHGKHNTQLNITFLCGVRPRPRTATIFASLGIPWKIMKHVLVIHVLKDNRYELGFIDEIPAHVLEALNDIVSPRITGSTSYKRAVAQSSNRTLGFGFQTHNSKVTESLGRYTLSFKHGVDDPNILLGSEAAYIRGNGWGALRKALESSEATIPNNTDTREEIPLTPSTNPETKLLAVRIQTLTREILGIEHAVAQCIDIDDQAEKTCMRLCDLNRLQQERSKLLGRWVTLRVDNHIRESIESKDVNACTRI